MLNNYHGYVSRNSVILAISFALLSYDACRSSELSRPAIGTSIDGLTFKDIRFLPRSLDDFGDKRVYVIVATNTTCPLVQRYIPKLNRLAEEFRSRDVQFIALNTATNESIPEIAAHALEMEICFPVVNDIQDACVALLGLQRTPEVVVLDTDRKLRYRGRIDDQYRLGGARPSVTDEDLQAAIVAVLGGKQPSPSETPVDGCRITRRLDDHHPDSNYADQIRPIMQTHCVECHRPGTEAPFSLRTYEEVANHALMIQEVTADRRMPPWYGSLADDHFANYRGLTTKEVDQIAAWVALDMPRGRPLNEVPDSSLEGDGEWLIGNPDLIISAAKQHQLPAEGYVPYQYEVLPYRFTQDTWIHAIQIRSNNASVLHHCNLLAIPSGKLPHQAEFITGKVPGSEPLVLNDDIAVLIPQGTTLLLQIHFTTTGKPEKCRLSVGVKYASGRIDKRFRHLLLKNTTFEIPPHASRHEVRQSAVIDRPTEGLGLFSHMHLRGKDMTFYAQQPDQPEERLLTVPNFSFDWQMGYRWASGQKSFPAGTRFKVIAHFDNSKFNPFNPNPLAIVREGPQTFHEMMYGFYFYTYADESLDLKIDPTTGHVQSVAISEDSTL